MESFKLHDYLNEVERVFHHDLRTPVKIYLKSMICIESIQILKELKTQVRTRTTEVINRLMSFSQKLVEDVKEKTKKCKNFLKNCPVTDDLKSARLFSFNLSFPENLGIIEDIYSAQVHLNQRTQLKDLNSKSISLNSLNDLDLKVFHQNHPTLIIFSEKHQKLFYTHALNTIEEFDYDSKRTTFKYIGHKDKVTAMELDDTQNTLASGSFDCNILLWNLKTHSLKGKISYGCPFTGLQFTKDSSKLLSSSIEKTLKVWDVESLKNIENFCQSSETISAFKLCPKGETLALGSGVIKLVNFNTKVLLAVSHRVSMQVISIEFSKNSEILYFSDKMSVKIWDLVNDSLKIVESLNLEGSLFQKLIVNNENDLLVYSINYEITVRSLKTLKSVAEFNFGCFILYHNQIINNKKLLVWTRSNGFLSASLDNSSFQYFAGHADVFRNARISGNKAVVVTSSYDLTLRVWDIETKSEQIVLKLDCYLNALGINFDGSLIAGSLKDEIIIWNFQNELLTKNSSFTTPKFQDSGKVLNISLINQNHLILALENFTFIHLKF